MSKAVILYKFNDEQLNLYEPDERNPLYYRYDSDVEHIIITDGNFLIPKIPGWTVIVDNSLTDKDLRKKIAYVRKHKYQYTKSDQAVIVAAKDYIGDYVVCDSTNKLKANIGKS